MLAALTVQHSKSTTSPSVQWWQEEPDSDDDDDTPGDGYADMRLLSNLDKGAGSLASPRRRRVTCCGTTGQLLRSDACWTGRGVALTVFVLVGIVCGVLGVLSTAGVKF